MNAYRPGTQPDLRSFLVTFQCLSCRTLNKMPTRPTWSLGSEAWMKFCSDPMMMELSLGMSALQTGLSAPLPLLIDQGILIRGVCTAGYPLYLCCLPLWCTFMPNLMTGSPLEQGCMKFYPLIRGFLVLNLISDQLVIFQRLSYRTLNRMPTRPAWSLGP